MSKTIRPHHRLLAWQEAIALVKDIYAATKHFPESERFGLTSQIRRAAVSIPSNIAEGAARTGNKELAQFLSIARGSLSEVETQVIIAQALGYRFDSQPILTRLDHVSRLVTGLQKHARSSV